MARLQIHTYEPDVSLDAAVPEYLNSPLRNTISSEEYYSAARRILPVLWLLHDAQGSASDWFRYTQAELFAEEHGIIIVCPNMENGFCTNMVRGVGWSDIFVLKLWPMVHKMLPTSDLRVKNYIAGIGMGGYGAVKLALENTSLFSKAAAFDGWLDAPKRVCNNTGDFPQQWALQDVFGEAEPDPQNDLQLLLRHAAASTPDALPEIHLSCSSQSVYCEANRCFGQTARELGFRVSEAYDRGNAGWRSANSQLEEYIGRIAR